MGVSIGALKHPLLYNYQYDQLNRLVKMDAWNSADSLWGNIGTTPLPDFQERVAYDPNGNILKYKRNGNNTFAGQPIGMDSLNYAYTYGTNKLDHISDSVPSGNYGNDLDNQSSGNYSYDAIGELTGDNASGITNVNWTVYGKIASIVKSNETISFTYDAAGNRVSKTVTPTSGTAVTTWYVRDAQGNIMSVYTSGDQTVNSGDLSRTEIDLYGSSRLGTITDSADVAKAPVYTRVALGLPDSGNVLTFMRGYKLFELTNHLGNVLATISDKKYGVSLDGSMVDHCIPAVVSANDYYPFGSQMPGRDTTLGGKYYRYGFNGKENDNEVNGVGDQQDYGMRIYDPRVGRFLSADPITSKFPCYTPYQFAGDKPIWATDLDGLEENTTSTYIKPPVVILSELRPTFKGIITITDQTSGKAHNTFQGTYQQLQKADQSRFALKILYVLTGPDPGKSTDRLNITIDNLPLRKEVDKNAESVDVNYYQHYSFTRTNKDHFVSQSGTFEANTGSVSNGSNSTAAAIAITELNVFGPALTGLSKLIDEAPVVNVTGRAAISDFKGRAGIYIHEFQSGTVYVGQTVDLGVRPWQSLRELVDATGKYKGTAAKAGDLYSGTTRFIPLEGSGFSTLNELESSAINHYGGTVSQGGSTYNIKRVNP